MADKLIMLDTSILIDFYRKTDKSNSVWVGLIRKGHSFAISSITKFEIYTGASDAQLAFWDKVLQTIKIFSFDDLAAENAVRVNQNLKRKGNKLILQTYLLQLLHYPTTWILQHSIRNILKESKD